MCTRVRNLINVGNVAVVLRRLAIWRPICLFIAERNLTPVLYVMCLLDRKAPLKYTCSIHIHKCRLWFFNKKCYIFYLFVYVLQNMLFPTKYVISSICLFVYVLWNMLFPILMGSDQMILLDLKSCSLFVWIDIEMEFYVFKVMHNYC